MAKHRSARQWASIIEAYRGSGLTQVEFSRRKGLALATLTYHLRRERIPGEDGSSGPEGEVVPKLLEIELPAPELAAALIVIEVPLKDGKNLRIHCPSRQIGEVLRQIPGLVIG